MIPGTIQRRNSHPPNPSRKLPVSGLPLEWMDAGAWTLPSGKPLAEFALQAGFLAPVLFKREVLKPPVRSVPVARRLRKEN